MWRSFLTTPALAAPSRRIDLIQVTRQLGEVDSKKCQSFSRLVKVEVVQSEREAEPIELCVHKQMRPAVPGIWLVDMDKRSLIGSYELRIMWIAGKSTVVVVTNTWQDTFDISDYLALSMQTGNDQNGSRLCVLSAEGFVPLEVFLSKYHKLDEHTPDLRRAVDAMRKLLIEQQPWCE
ncbi:MAG: hypothetical protein D6816_16200 [Bacteroidetes bacterium]|nr:MAG: hypothetical protein D6816_16200 [Bacteroidota bacterium]